MKLELRKFFKTVWHKKHDYGMIIVKTPKDKLIRQGLIMGLQIHKWSMAMRPKRKIIHPEAW